MTAIKEDRVNLSTKANVAVVKCLFLLFEQIRQLIDLLL